MIKEIENIFNESIFRKVTKRIKDKLKNLNENIVKNNDINDIIISIDESIKDFNGMEEFIIFTDATLDKMVTFFNTIMSNDIKACFYRVEFKKLHVIIILNMLYFINKIRRYDLMDTINDDTIFFYKDQYIYLGEVDIEVDNFKTCKVIGKTLDNKRYVCCPDNQNLKLFNECWENLGKKFDNLNCSNVVGIIKDNKIIYD